ncbi:hypothetical protein BGX29_011380 [Mortierella sp. GBA35]|nr:hypothetical protein BGX29_011380 [Mortierella sp. GBA35]
MDPLSLLPPECLHLILQAITRQNKSLGTLAALLQTNKYFATATLPYLYSNPYRTWASIWFLTRTLLDQAKLASPPKILRLIFGVDPYDRPTPLDYLAHLRHLDLDPGKFENYRAWLPIDLESDEWLEYIQSQDFRTLCRLDRLLPALKEAHGQDLLEWIHCGVLKRETTWAIAALTLEQLQTLIVPISDIDRYLGVVHRLRNLEHVRFLLDEIFDYESDYFHYGDEPAGFIDSARRRKEEAMAAMVRFVQEHARLFRGRLKTAGCFSLFLWPIPRQNFPVEIQLQMVRLLPPLRNLKTLDSDNWLQFLAHPESTYLGHVRNVVILPPLGA